MNYFYNQWGKCGEREFSVKLTESLIKLRNMKSKCHLWSGHHSQSVLSRELKKTVSLACVSVTSVLEPPGEGDVPHDRRGHASDFVLSVSLFLLSAPGTAGCPAGEEGCQGLVCPLPA